MPLNRFPECVVIADAHIKNRLWTNNSRIEGDAYMALDKIGSYRMLHKKEPSILLSAGDLFDVTRPTANDVHEAVNLAKQFDEFLYIDGNHDKVEPSWMESILPTAVHLDQNPYWLDDVTAVFGIDFTPDYEEFCEKLTYISSHTVAAYKIILIHQSVSDFIGIPGMGMCSAQDILRMAGPNCVIYCGDTHRSMRIDSYDKTSVIISPGSLVPANISQAALDHNFLSFNKTNIMNPEPHFISVRNYVFCESVEALMDAVKNPCKENKPLPDVLFCSFLTGTPVPKFTEEQLGDRILIVRFVGTDESSSDVLLEEEIDRYTLEDAVIDDIRATTAKERIPSYSRLALGLMSSDDPAGYLEKLLVKLNVVRSEQ